MTLLHRIEGYWIIDYTLGTMMTLLLSAHIANNYTNASSLSSFNLCTAVSLWSIWQPCISWCSLFCTITPIMCSTGAILPWTHCTGGDTFRVTWSRGRDVMWCDVSCRGVVWCDRHCGGNSSYLQQILCISHCIVHKRHCTQLHWNAAYERRRAIYCGGS